MDLVYRHVKTGGDVDYVVTVVDLFGSAVVVQGKALTREGEESESLKCQVKTNECLTSDCLETNDSRRKYCDLRRFSTKFLDNFVDRLLNDGLTTIGFDGETPSLSSLPYDCSIVIMAMLDFRTLARMTCVNKFYKDFCGSAQFLWKVI